MSSTSWLNSRHRLKKGSRPGIRRARSDWKHRASLRVESLEDRTVMNGAELLPPQILLDVDVAEIQRNALRRAGISLDSIEVLTGNAMGVIVDSLSEQNTSNPGDTPTDGICILTDELAEGIVVPAGAPFLGFAESFAGAGVGAQFPVPAFDQPTGVFLDTSEAANDSLMAEGWDWFASPWQSTGDTQIGDANLASSSEEQGISDAGDLLWEAAEGIGGTVPTAAAPPAPPAAPAAAQPIDAFNLGATPPAPANNVSLAVSVIRGDFDADVFSPGLRRQQQMTQLDFVLNASPREWRLYKHSQEEQSSQTDPFYWLQTETYGRRFRNSVYGHMAAAKFGNGPPINQLYDPNEFVAALRNDQIEVFRPALVTGALAAGFAWGLANSLVVEPVLSGVDLGIMQVETAYDTARAFGAPLPHWNPSYYSGIGQMTAGGAGYTQIGWSMVNGFLQAPEQAAAAIQTGNFFALGEMASQPVVITISVLGPAKFAFNWTIRGVGGLGGALPRRVGQSLINFRNGVRQFQVNVRAAQTEAWFARQGMELPPDLRWVYDPTLPANQHGAFRANFVTDNINANVFVRNPVVRIGEAAFTPRPFVDLRALSNSRGPGYLFKPWDQNIGARMLLKGRDAFTHEAFHAYQAFLDPMWFRSARLGPNGERLHYLKNPAEFTQSRLQALEGAWNFEARNAGVSSGRISGFAGFQAGMDAARRYAAYGDLSSEPNNAHPLRPLDFSFFVTPAPQVGSLPIGQATSADRRYVRIMPSPDLLEGTTADAGQPARNLPDRGTLLLRGFRAGGGSPAEAPSLSEISYINRLFRSVGLGRGVGSLHNPLTPRIIDEDSGR